MSAATVKVASREPKHRSDGRSSTKGCSAPSRLWLIVGNSRILSLQIQRKLRLLAGQCMQRKSRRNAI